MSDSMQKDETVERLRAYPLQTHLDALFEKRVLKRERALLGLVDAFTRKWQLDFAEEKLPQRDILLALRTAVLWDSPAKHLRGTYIAAA